MIRPVHQQRRRSTSKPQANKHSTTKRKPNKTTEHLAKKQQRARETSKFKIQETSRLSVRKPYQNKGQHLDKDATRQLTSQEKTKEETTRPEETSKFKNKGTSVLSPKKHNTKPQHLIKTQTDTEPQ